MTDTTATPRPGLHVLRQLVVARANMPVLVAAERGEGVDGRDFFYPADDDLRVAAEKALRDAGLLLVPDEEPMRTEGGDAVLRWQLVHLETGDARTYRLTWGRFAEETRSAASSAWASAATWSHATRHLLLKLLNARVISRAEHVRLGFEGKTSAPASEALDRLCGEMPAWASPSLPAPPPAPATPAGLLAAIEGVLGGVAQLGSGAASEEWRRQLEAIPVLLEPVVVRVRALERLADVTPPPATTTPPAQSLASPAPDPARARPFDRLTISEPLRRWKEREHTMRLAVDPAAAPPTMADAWGAATGGAARQPVNGEEFARLFEYLLADDARHGGAT